jgi:hypothetical protein
LDIGVDVSKMDTGEGLAISTDDNPSTGQVIDITPCRFHGGQKVDTSSFGGEFPDIARTHGGMERKKTTQCQAAGNERNANELASEVVSRPPGCYA